MHQRLREVYESLRFKGLVKNQTDFGTQLGYNKSYFSQLMNGAEPITDNVMLTIETMFGINKGYFTGNGPMFTEPQTPVKSKKESGDWVAATDIPGFILDETDLQAYENIRNKVASKPINDILMELYAEIERLKSIINEK